VQLDAYAEDIGRKHERKLKGKHSDDPDTGEETS